MTRIPIDVSQNLLQIIGHDGLLSLGGNNGCWVPLREWHDVRPVSGVYLLGLTRGVQYDLGVSRIVYIGATRNLQTRIQTHAALAQPSRRSIKLRYPDGLVAAIVTIPGLSSDWLHACLRPVRWKPPGPH